MPAHTHGCKVLLRRALEGLLACCVGASYCNGDGRQQTLVQVEELATLFSNTLTPFWQCLLAREWSAGEQTRGAKAVQRYLSCPSRRVREERNQSSVKAERQPGPACCFLCYHHHLNQAASRFLFHPPFPFTTPHPTSLIPPREAGTAGEARKVCIHPELSPPLPFFCSGFSWRFSKERNFSCIGSVSIWRHIVSACLCSSPPCLGHASVPQN